MICHENKLEQRSLISFNSALFSHSRFLSLLSQFCHKCRCVTAVFHTVDRGLIHGEKSLLASSRPPRAVITGLFVSRIKTRRFTNCAAAADDGGTVDYVSNILDPGGQIEEKINARIH